MLPLSKRYGLGLMGLVAVFFITACSSLRPPSTAAAPDKPVFSGRISLQVDSEPVQTFAGGFELQGNESAGQLSLFTPLGGTVAVLRWQPGRAQLQNGSDTQEYPSVQAMLQRTTGAAIPLPALFAWLRGQAFEAPGWQADVSRHSDGRISAQRTDPLPAARLRIVLEP
jgi:outer membrane lipoprotein LolB